LQTSSGQISWQVHIFCWRICQYQSIMPCTMSTHGTIGGFTIRNHKNFFIPRKKLLHVLRTYNLKFFTQVEQPRHLWELLAMLKF
jgi:hypothetical protein